MRSVLRRFGFPSLVVVQLVVSAVVVTMGADELALPGGQPAPAVLAVLVVGAVVAAAPFAVRLSDVERQAARGGVSVRLLTTVMAGSLLLVTLALVATTDVDGRVLVVWTGTLWSIGVVAGRLLGAGSWLMVVAPGLVGFLMAGQVDDDGERWFLALLGTAPSLGVAGVCVAAAVTAGLLLPGASD